ncbi:hypothetical protein PENANT_c003G05850 [Penicillium antarcticum]|uniref:DUF3533 domain-containing protein n=1 Tax=Penicillium antarcticum TaxID=416450 RepID=A0A1V6QHR6_9EURO|nr:uncharacterized protein N7508_005955 [Penicillium antarcticum]KAJ5306940.1 hypothetical protein N7508_005955 [Penicillium antarcticum]OQD88770.1 hypothetical protein PENANT_c003G05850 [Penicillium antarcticum]
MQFYPKAREQRPSIHHPSVRPRRLAVLKAATVNLFLLQILFLGLFCYIFGSLFQQSSHIHNINVLFVDYDGGAIGDAVRDAYQKLEGAGFPNLIERPASLYPQAGNIEGAVCDIKFWGGLYITSNASDALTAAFAGGSAASSYDNSNVITMVWNEARYPTVVDSALQTSLKSLSEAGRVAYSHTNGERALKSLDTSDPAALAAFSNPWTLASTNIQPTSQGSRLIYNTLVIILIMIQEFFYLGTVNGLYAQFNLYASVSPHRIAIVRQIISVVYTFVGSLCTTGAIWAFRHGWHVNGGQFMLTWMALWLFAHLNFLVMDVFTIWLPPPYVPMALISWVVTNVTSILLPFELSPAFYQVGYALPAHSIFQVLIDIWSGGCNPLLNYALPVMFLYEILGIVLSTIGVYRRSHYATLKKEIDEKALEERVAAALAEQQAASLVRQQTLQDEQESRTADTENEERPARPRRETVTTMADQEELVDILRREISKPQAEKSDGRDSTGPSFALPYKD